ncbi:MAG TPA: 16S rRNA (adenine(1518)-N(6)/adenine(1519)-N(6))-dimethyltransferase RsmA [Saprospiraceae bacterium]|nr:16S rRNA (adenine(1518)-N(6)/adenine(1519)-N(6))-dimethyltransferase RsmA [Saprospiraceae bacterium]
MQAKKSFGQHFLTQPRVIERIVELILSLGTGKLVEIGPGRGAITKLLKNSVQEFKALEADKDMVQHLLSEFPELENKLIQADVLKYDFKTLFENQEFNLCGNFPYNISSQIVIKVLENADLIPYMVGMFQKEMALRLCGKQGTKDYGPLAILCNRLYEVKIMFDVNRMNFSPPPNVLSSIVLFKRKENRISHQEYSELQKLLRQAFQFRRKTLRNNLKSTIQNALWLEEPIFDKRPEDLSPQDYLALCERLRK